jgi:uncharacterized protein (TIGR02996 family)
LTRHDDSQLLEHIAQRPFDRASRAVYADWLLERGDARGEVILASTRGELALSERRRLGKLTAAHQHEWLGPLAPLLDLSRTTFVDGFLDEACLLHSVSPAQLDGMLDDPRWATVQSLRFPMRLPVEPSLSLLRSPRLISLQEVHAPCQQLPHLVIEQRPVFSLSAIGAASWGVFENELDALSEWHAQTLGFSNATHLKLTTSEFINSASASELKFQVQRHLVAEAFTHVQLCIQYGAIEGVAQWLIIRDAQAHLDRAGKLEHWSVEYGDALFTLSKTSNNRLQALQADLRGKEGAVGLGQRVAALATVLVQLAPAALESVVVKLPPKARLKNDERDALRAAMRRLGTVKHFHLDDATATP